jgi:NAD(P)-dependent dehydrogenase (short-subunit alcohol dehydrogenase family)
MIATRPGCPPERVLVVPCDVTVPAQVHDMVTGVHRRFGRLDILVNNAGFNLPRRTLAEMDLADWERIVATNLDGAFLCVHAVLPIMRAQSGGTLIHIGSQAARRPSTLAGAAYTAAKAGLAGLSAVINAEERRHGMRSSLLILGDVDTPLLDQRPEPPPAAARALALQPEDVAACVVLIATLPGRVTVEELALLPTWGG